MSRFEDRQELLEALLEVHEERDVLHALFERIAQSTLERTLKPEIVELDDVLEDEDDVCEELGPLSWC
ncbi:MAG: hypothetical protein HOE14_00705 [Gemmatimonadales bacterium]|jgi:hypothetical protein|nr:hypothetical protein [Gemmatimonadales bacterium]